MKQTTTTGGGGGGGDDMNAAARQRRYLIDVPKERINDLPDLPYHYAHEMRVD